MVQTKVCGLLDRETEVREGVESRQRTKAACGLL